MRLQQKIVPCLWFDEQAEEAAAFYSEIFPDSRIIRVTRYGEAALSCMRRSMAGLYSTSTRSFPAVATLRSGGNRSLLGEGGAPQGQQIAMVTPAGGAL